MNVLHFQNGEQLKIDIHCSGCGLLWDIQWQWTSCDCFSQSV